MVTGICCNSTLMVIGRFLLRFGEIAPLWHQASLKIAPQWRLVYVFFFFSIVMETVKCLVIMTVTIWLCLGEQSGKECEHDKDAWQT